MGFRLPSLMAVAVAAAASAHAALAQGAASTGLGGSSGDGQPPPLVLAEAAADPAATATATPAPADTTEASGRAQRQLPQAKGAEPDPLDPTATGTISHKVPETEDDPFAALGIRAGSFILYPVADHELRTRHQRLGQRALEHADGDA